jgi:hypothetical protein
VCNQKADDARRREKRQQLVIFKPPPPQRFRVVSSSRFLRIGIGTIHMGFDLAVTIGSIGHLPGVPRVSFHDQSRHCLALDKRNREVEPLQ